MTEVRIKYVIGQRTQWIILDKVSKYLVKDNTAIIVRGAKDKNYLSVTRYKDFSKIVVIRDV